jgi:hypothetical protein
MILILKILFFLVYIIQFSTSSSSLAVSGPLRSRYYDTETFHHFRSLPKLLFHFGRCIKIYKQREVGCISCSLSHSDINLTFQCHSVLTEETMTPELQQGNCYISAGRNADTHSMSEAHRLATLPLNCHSLAGNQFVELLTAFVV